MREQEASFEIGMVLEGRYRLVSAGPPNDLGQTYKVYDVEQDRLLVLLVLDRRWGRGREALHRLRMGQQALASLTAPGLVACKDVGVVGDQLYTVAVRPEGEPLADLLAGAGRLEMGSAIQIAIQICEALAPAHRAGLVHGGLSSQSVLLRRAGDRDEATHPAVTLLDFGLLPALQPAHDSAGRPWGRSPYFSPEQAAGEDLHPAADVYVIGSLLYEMLTGRPPFRASDETVLALQHLRQEPPSLQILLPHVPPPLAQIVHKALAKEPAARYRNASQLAHILRSQLGEYLPSEQAEPVAAVAAPARERLVVPPPPAPAAVAAQQPWRFYELEEENKWVEEPEGVDWLMIGLLIAAVIAVLGLIPLWRTVHRRYTAPPPASAAALPYRLGTDGCWLPSEACGLAAGAQQSGELDPIALIWYNRLPTLRICGEPACAERTLASSLKGNDKESSSLGVELTGFVRKA